MIGGHGPAALLGAGLHAPAPHIHHPQCVGEAHVAGGHQGRVLTQGVARRHRERGALLFQDPPGGHAAGEDGELGPVGPGELLHGPVAAQLADVPAQDLLGLGERRPRHGELPQVLGHPRRLAPLAGEQCE